jgi:hypothetical protein
MKFKFCCLKKEPEEVLKVIANYPLYECAIANTDWEEHGLAVLYVCRSAMDCRYTAAFYMVDTYCLGLKNTYAMVNGDRDQMLDIRSRIDQGYSLTPYDYEDARSLILGAVEYAGLLGFQPNEDWRDTRHIIEADRAYARKFTFGKDGKPYYIQGPDDDARKVTSKLATIDHHYLVRAH